MLHVLWASTAMVGQSKYPCGEPIERLLRSLKRLSQSVNAVGRLLEEGGISVKVPGQPTEYPRRLIGALGILTEVV